MLTPKSGQDDSSPPLPKKGRGRMRVKSAPSPAVAIAAKKSRRQLYMKHPLLDLQAKESGDSKSASNSSDDDDESDLSCISQGQNHPNAEHHVYLDALGSQTTFHTPLHRRRASIEERVPVAGESSMFLHVFFCFDIPQT